MPTINDLRQQAATIKNATQVGENTATRVGTTFETIADLLEGASVGQGVPSVDLSQLNELRTPADQTTANPTIYNVTTLHNLSSTTIKVGTLFIFSDAGRAVVTQILLSNYQVDGGGNISSPNASQITMYYRMFNIVQETWSAWTLYAGGGGGGTIDPYPVSGSDNAVASNGVFEWLQKAAPEVNINDIDDLDDFVDMQTGVASTYTIKAYHNLSSTWLRVGVLMVFANQAQNTLTQICISNCMVDGGGNLIPNYTTNVMNVFYRFKQFSGNPPEGMTIGVWTTWAKFGDSGYQPDNEDIDLNASDQLQLANKLYDVSAFSGLGRVYLRKNIVTLGGVGKNVLTQAMVNTANTIYHIQYDYDLNGQTITLPAGCVLMFDGGSVKNGILSGVLVTSSGKINAKELGCTYNDTTKCVENVARLKILEGVTNAIHLQVTDTLYLGSGYVEISDSIKIDGGGELRVSGFNGFKVVGNVEVENIKIYGSDIYTSGGTTSKFIDVQAGTPNNVTIKNCYFKGNIRVLHSSKTTDAELTEYFNNITIEGNTFEDIACQPSSIMVYLSDTNYRELYFSGNRIHNFLGVFIHCGITNDTEHAANIANFYAKFGRNTVFKNNNVFNDIDFKPWDRVAFYAEGAQYYTFALVEKGECYFEKNSVQNIFSNYSGTAVYDSYLSVDNLYYQSNNVKNCFNLTGAYNACLKSKGGSGNRLYANNTIVTENVDDYFDSVVYKTSLMDTERNTLNQVQIENNIFDVQNWAQTTGHRIGCARLIVRGNSFHAKYIGGRDNAASLYSVLGNNSRVVYFENNSVDFENLSADFISRKNRAACILANDEPNTTCYVSIKNNIIKNCILYDSSNADATGIYGEISGNEITYSLERVNTGISTLFSLSNNGKLNLHDNKISQNTGNQTALSMCPYNTSYKTKVRFVNTSKTTLYLAQFDTARRRELWYEAFGGLLKFTIKIINHVTGKKYIGEVNVTIDSTYALGTIKAYKDDGNLITFSSASYTYNMVNNTQSIIYLHPTQGYISLALSLMPANADLEIEMDVESVASINKFKYHKTSGTTALRPAILAQDDLGFEYFDTTLGKPVYAKAIDASTGAVTWVDSSGAAL